MDNDMEHMANDILDNIANFEDHELSGFRSTIADDVQQMLIESNTQSKLTNNPDLTIILITSIHSDDPCSSCVENLTNVSSWAERNSHFGNRMRILLVDSSRGFDNRKIWSKLKLSFNDVPISLFFNHTHSLIDIVQGTMSENYLDTFWSSFFSD